MATDINYNTRQVDPLPGPPIRVKIETAGPNSWQVAVTNLETNELIPVQHGMTINIPASHDELITAEVKLIVSELVMDGVFLKILEQQESVVDDMVAKTTEKVIFQIDRAIT